MELDAVPVGVLDENEERKKSMCEKKAVGCLFIRVMQRDKDDLFSPPPHTILSRFSIIAVKKKRK